VDLLAGLLISLGLFEALLLGLASRDEVCMNARVSLLNDRIDHLLDALWVPLL
jgi:hypothetical protein